LRSCREESSGWPYKLSIPHFPYKGKMEKGESQRGMGETIDLAHPLTGHSQKNHTITTRRRTS